jgi:hypothetical protein
VHFWPAPRNGRMIGGYFSPNKILGKWILHNVNGSHNESVEVSLNSRIGKPRGEIDLHNILGQSTGKKRQSRMTLPLIYFPKCRYFPRLQPFLNKFEDSHKKRYTHIWEAFY